jgi:hypothetical protein
MSSMSTSINGFGTNGLVPHGTENGQLELSYPNGDQAASTSFSTVNGYTQWVQNAPPPFFHVAFLAYCTTSWTFYQHRVFSPPYQLHNEEIVNHLYNAGFQTGVRTCSSVRFPWCLHWLMRREQNYADTILVKLILVSGCSQLIFSQL